MDNVIFLPIKITEGQLDSERVLQAAIAADLADTLVMGITKDGRFYCACSTDAREAMIFIERARLEILKSLGAL